MKEKLERAGLFKRVRHPFPNPVNFSKSAEHVSQIFSFGNKRVQLSCPNAEILKLFKIVLGPMMDNQIEITSNNDIVSLQYHGDGFGVFVNGVPVFGRCEFVYARHLIMREIAVSLAGRCNVSATFHAAAAGTRDQVVIFAADSGSGKSTLTAALAAKGFVYHNDDQVAVLKEQGRISSFPTQIGLKKGSWTVAEMAGHNIDDIAPTFMGDGYLKLVEPKAIGVSQIQPKIAAIVFPSYKANCEFNMERLADLEAMERLFISGCRLAGRYPTILSLAQTLAMVPAFALNYDNTSQAVSAVSNLLKTD